MNYLDFCEELFDKLTQDISQDYSDSSFFGFNNLIECNWTRGDGFTFTFKIPIAQYQRFPQYMLSIELYDEIIVNNFTTLSIKDYLIIMKYCLKDKTTKSKLKVDSLLNTYLLIKMLIDRRQALNKTFPNGWKYKEAITLKFLLQKTSLSSTTLRKYLEALIELGLIEKNTVKKETLYKLKNT